MIKIEQEKINVKAQVFSSVGQGGDKTWQEATETWDEATYTWDSSTDSLGNPNKPKVKVALKKDNITVKI